MARLNEPPVAPAAPATALAGGVGGGVESVDALKRRFIRQNRELAKNNSTQSLRIRSLEIEVSRLLQTNLELREELLRSRNAEHDARKQSSNEGVRGFKEEMMAKLKELSGIVEGIEDVQEADKDDMLEKEERRMSVLSQMEFRERQPLADLMRDCQMPTIAENKIHPRRTLEPEEIRAVRLSDGSSNGSPDLGPPPVARFDCQDPIKFDSVPMEDRQETPVEAETEIENKQQDEELPANLSINLETRRKRRDGQPRLEMRRASILPPPSPTSTDSETSAPTLRTGAKRKLADRDLDKPAKGPSQTDFTFNRKTNTEPTKTDAEPLPQPEEKLETVEIPPPAPQSARKVLGDKSVNMSPRKATAQPEKPEKDDLKKPAQPKLSAVKDRSKARRSRLSAIPPPPPEPEVSVATIELPTIQSPAAQAESGPNTPAAHDFFSPTPSQPSAGPNERAPTPPPTGPSGATTEATRPSRRARSAVNYAEPSLNAKMRRQEKNMMDAVTGLQHHRHAMSASAERKARSSITVKEEPKDEDAWKSLPETGEPRRSSVGVRARSPLEAKSGELTNIDSLVKPESDGRGHGLEQKSNQTEKASSLATSENSLAHPANHESTTGPDTDLDDAARKLQELDLYDFKDSSSSPSTASSAVGSSNSTTERAPAAKSSSAASNRTHRRHSSIHKEAAHAGSEPARASGRTAATSSSRRRSMMT